MRIGNACFIIFINCHKSYVWPQDWLSRGSCKVPYQLDIVQDVLLINFPFTCFSKKVVHRPATLPKLESITTFPENQAKFPSEEYFQATATGGSEKIVNPLVPGVH